MGAHGRVALSSILEDSRSQFQITFEYENL